MQVGSLSAEWLAEERTQVVGTFPPKKRKWGYVEKDTAGQTNIYSVEVINSPSSYIRNIQTPINLSFCFWSARR
jgi:hypothetical protein